jgi:hypothetical protein
MAIESFVSHIYHILNKRQQMYGPPEDNLMRIAKRWSLTLGQEITPQQAALCMLDVKLARLTRDPGHYDSIMDVVGYAACLDEINRYQEEADETRS